MVETTPLTPVFGARIRGLDIGRGLDAASMAELRDALDRFSVLVFPEQRLDDAAQIAFSEGFGPLERTRPGAPGAGSPVVVLSNIGPDGTIAPPTDKQVLNNKANRLWHHDSSFKPVPARASLLSAREIPSAGGDTEFASMRAAFASLDPAEQAALRGRVAIHDFGWSRTRVDAALVTEAERGQHPPVRQALVLEENPHGPALYLGAHARSIEGMDEAESRALIDRLMALATQPAFTYAHKWQPHDLVVWDNRAVLHRATPFATTTERRHMVRTCVAGTAPTLAAAA
ncbi:TauD/TfdA family dioxygenase [Roseomonas sp. M0104]|uniref:TauD/TfdA family dioxygenase n=1 Tax=Teichococcus coralli TaxID=2545983 RepID=A0A845BE43_9PROT|nr:TauD/TfdA family dioxygenase [Pseudoroseomonas coralli]MXP65205.1 TauD/TfdA family dioxygenase [Pseudoroseomonas coralli]